MLRDMTQRARSLDIARRREVAARHHLDPRTLDRAIRDGADALRGMAADRARAALAELGLSDAQPPPSGQI